MLLRNLLFYLSDLGFSNFSLSGLYLSSVKVLKICFSIQIDIMLQVANLLELICVCLLGSTLCILKIVHLSFLISHIMQV